MRIKTHQKKSTFVTLISEENETRNKNPANFFTLQNNPYRKIGLRSKPWSRKIMDVGLNWFDMA